MKLMRPNFGLLSYVIIRWTSRVGVKDHDTTSFHGLSLPDDLVNQHAGGHR